MILPNKAGAMTPPFPTTKISQTILEFGRDVILDLPENHTKEELEACMSVIVTVWNAVTFDQWEGGHKWADVLSRQMASAPPEMRHLIKMLVKRKKKKFGSDPRGVGKTWVTFKNGEYVFGCEARVNVEKMRIGSAMQ